MKKSMLITTMSLSALFLFACGHSGDGAKVQPRKPGQNSPDAATRGQGQNAPQIAACSAEQKQIIDAAYSDLKSQLQGAQTMALREISLTETTTGEVHDDTKREFQLNFDLKGVKYSTRGSASDAGALDMAEGSAALQKNSDKEEADTVGAEMTAHEKNMQQIAAVIHQGDKNMGFLFTRNANNQYDVCSYLQLTAVAATAQQANGGGAANRNHVPSGQKQGQGRR